MSSVNTKNVLFVTKGNTDGSILKGDVLYFGSDGVLVNLTVGGWLDKEDLTPSVMDFKYRVDKKHRVEIIGGREQIVAVA